MNKRLIWNFEINDKQPLNMVLSDDKETPAERWESRFFWPESEIIILNGLDERFLALSHYEIKYKQDKYYLLADKPYNLKVRRDQLLYKPIAFTTDYAMAYEKKIILGAVDHSTPVTNKINTSILLSEVQEHGQPIQVEKEALIYRFETTPTLKLELARIHVANTTWFSVNIESRSKQLVDTLRRQLFGDKKTCDYVTFLKDIHLQRLGR